jgi:outer membrane receptor protein involved in Fe transport
MHFPKQTLVMMTAFAISGGAVAQSPMEEVVVTATKRAESLQDVPLSVSVIEAQTIERAEIRDLIDLQSVVPSLRVPQFQNSTQTNFVIRGFGNGANNPVLSHRSRYSSTEFIAVAHLLVSQTCPTFSR